MELTQARPVTQVFNCSGYSGGLGLVEMGHGSSPQDLIVLT